MRKLSLFAILSIILAASCKKEDADPVVTPVSTSGRAALLSGTTSTPKAWYINRVTVNGAEVTKTLYEPCELDNLFRFGNSGDYREEEGPTKCNNGDPDVVVSGKWMFRANNDSLIIQEPLDTTRLQIRELTATSLKVRGTERGNTAEVEYLSR